MDKPGNRQSRRLNSWVLVSIALAGLAVTWRFCSDPKPDSTAARPTERVRTSPAPKPASDFRPAPKPFVARSALPAPAQASKEIIRAAPASPRPPANPVVFERETEHGEPWTPTAPPEGEFEPYEVAETESGLPPCPEPYEDLRATLEAESWGEMEVLLDDVLERDDCDRGRWPDLGWVRQTAQELARAEVHAPQNPAQVMHSMHDSVLSLFEGDATLSESRLTVDEARRDPQTGLTVVSGTDPQTGESIEVMTPQAIEPGEELQYWRSGQAVDKAEVIHDMIRYAPMMDRAHFNRFRSDPSLRARLPEHMRSEFARMDEVAPMDVDQALRKARDRMRSQARLGLAALDEIEAQYEADKQQALERRKQQEETLREAVEGFLAFRGTPPGSTDEPLQGAAEP